jgi:hypothetical protein
MSKFLFTVYVGYRYVQKHFEKLYRYVSKYDQKMEAQLLVSSKYVQYIKSSWTLSLEPSQNWFAVFPP